MTEVAQLVGDLAVLSVQLAESSWPRRERGVMATFHSWQTFAAPWLELAMATGAAIHANPQDATPEVVEPLVAALSATFLGELHGAIVDRFDYIGHEYGFLYGGFPWVDVCAFRSALETVRVLVAGDAHLHDELVATELERLMVRWGDELFEPGEPMPHALPPWHWWWSRPSPPGSEHVSRRMAELQGQAVASVPTGFVEWVRRGVQDLDTLLARPVAIDALVDARDARTLAAVATSCARWLAHELRRCGAPGRIHASVRPAAGTASLRCHRLREGMRPSQADVEAVHDEAVLVLDTDDFEV